MALTTLVLIMFAGCCLVFLANKMIAANLYERTYQKVHHVENKSPYSISMQRDSTGSWGWSMMKNGEIVKDEKNIFAVYKSAEILVRDINRIEKSEGYDLTKI